MLGLDNLSLRTPQHAPETPGTMLQRRIEKSLGDQFQEQMGSFQCSMMDAFNKLAATVTVSKHPQDPAPHRGTRLSHIQNRVRAQLPALPDLGISKFPAMNPWTLPQPR